MKSRPHWIKETKAEKELKKQMLEKQLDEHGYNFCETCKRNITAIPLRFLTFSHGKQHKQMGGTRKQLATLENENSLECLDCHKPNRRG